MSESKLQNSSAPIDTDDLSMEIDLLELFYNLLENAKRIVAAALAGMLIMAVYSFVLARPTYEAVSKLYVMSSSDSAINLSDLQIGSYLTSDYQEVFDTWEVRELVLRNLNLEYTYEELEEMVTISNPADTRVLYITVTSGSPQEAAAIANEMARVASNYISEVMETDTPSVLSEALVPVDPIAPRKALNVVLGFLLGAILMIVIVVIKFFMDDKIKTSDDIRRYGDMATLAIVPTNSTNNRASLSKSGTSRTAPRAERRGSK